MARRLPDDTSVEAAVPHVTRLSAPVVFGGLGVLALLTLLILRFSPGLSQLIQRKPAEFAPTVTLTPTPKPEAITALPSTYPAPPPMVMQAGLVPPLAQSVPSQDIPAPIPPPVQTYVPRPASPGEQKPTYPDTLFPQASPRVTREQLAKHAMEQEPPDSAASFVNKGTVQPPPGRFAIMQGSIIPVTLEPELSSNVCGNFKSLVREPVRDTATGRYILIPIGSTIVGTYECKTAYGDERLPLTAARLIFPDTSSLVLDDGFPGVGALGATGVDGKINNHWMRTSIAILASAVLGTATRFAAGSVSTYGDRSPGQDFAVNAANETARVGNRILNRELNLAPTITVPRSKRINVYVLKDLVFESPYYGIR